ncbi:MAG: hypothetical protein ABJC13_05630 [Acidobacteriota bacterium]
MANALRLEDFLPATLESQNETGEEKSDLTGTQGSRAGNFLAVQLEFLRAARKLREFAAESKEGDQRFESALQQMVAEATAKVARGEALDLTASVEELRTVEARLESALKEAVSTFGENRKFPPAAQIIDGLKRRCEQTRDARWQLLALRAEFESESGSMVDKAADLEKILAD